MHLTARGSDRDTWSSNVQGFKEGPESVMILQDDGFHLSPTSANIMAAFKWMGDGAKAGDSLFVHYSGHGGECTTPRSRQCFCCLMGLFGRRGLWAGGSG